MKGNCETKVEKNRRNFRDFWILKSVFFLLAPGPECVSPAHLTDSLTKMDACMFLTFILFPCVSEAWRWVFMTGMCLADVHVTVND